jgi:transposase
MFQTESASAQGFRARTETARGTRKTIMIVVLAHKLLVALWRLVRDGVVPDGVALRPWRNERRSLKAPDSSAQSVRL